MDGIRCNRFDRVDRASFLIFTPEYARIDYNRFRDVYNNYYDILLRRLFHHHKANIITYQFYVVVIVFRALTRADHDFLGILHSFVSSASEGLFDDSRLNIR